MPSVAVFADAKGHNKQLEVASAASEPKFILLTTVDHEHKSTSVFCLHIEDFGDFAKALWDASRQTQP